MNALEFLKKHPQSVEVVREWFFNKMAESIDDSLVPEDFKKSMMEEAVTNERLAVLIDANPRMLFDVFDENDIFISINITDRKFTYRIDNVINPTEYSTRKECELISITRAFEILENKLTPKELIDETDN